ncbi:MAG: amylo-alpha-1,6-glucosidase, partial [Verrucomicrobiota bacterium]
GRLWSLLRNRLCALTSVSGGYGFTCGVEWLAAEKIQVHSSRGLSWGNAENLLPELAELNRLLAEHPCFFDSARLTRLSAHDSPVYALRRDSAEGIDSVLVLVNTDDVTPGKFLLSAAAFREWNELPFELLKQKAPRKTPDHEGNVVIHLEPGACYCLSPTAKPKGLHGDAYRKFRAQAAWAVAALKHAMAPEEISRFTAPQLAAWIDRDPVRFLAGIVACQFARYENRDFDFKAFQEKKGKVFPAVIVWSLPDQRRVTPIPPDHWLLLCDPSRFRVTLELASRSLAQHAESIATALGHVAAFPPQEQTGDALLVLERYGATQPHASARFRFLSRQPDLSRIKMEKNDPRISTRGGVSLANPRVAAALPARSALDAPVVLLTNGIGGMARLCIDLGSVKSKYDCLLGANLHPEFPVDRHVLAKRVRIWVNADGFITALNAHNLVQFTPGPPAQWRFVANAGDGRKVEIRLTTDMLEGRNTTVLHFERPAEPLPFGRELPAQFGVRLTVRIDIEDRSFHAETLRNPGADYHFATHSHPLPDRPGFAFTPAPDRRLRVYAAHGSYHHEGEWSLGIPHPIEQTRGHVGAADAFSPGWFDLPLGKGDANTVVVTAEPADPEPEQLLRFRCGRPAENEQGSEATALEASDLFAMQLARATRAFVVRRNDAKTIIAGYPWFLDWGRDTLICARGLLAIGWVDEVIRLLIGFGRFEENGTLPNSIHGSDASNRDTSDAPLWYGVACQETAAILGASFYETPVDRHRTIGDVLRRIGLGYLRGTSNGIRFDPVSGLIWSPKHFTWMDTNFPAGTPRMGYPIEIQALWIALLQQLETMGAHPSESGHDSWRGLAAHALESIEKFYWLPELGYFADVIQADPGQPAERGTVDSSLRSNFLFAISLGLVGGERARMAVAEAQRHLVVPGALRSLAPLPVAVPLPIYGNDGRLLNNPREPYWGRYEGDEDTRRKPAYHNGTAWVWTLPSFCEAMARAWDFAPTAVAAAKAYLASMDELLSEGCLGHLPEILDGDAPHQPRGCDAQSWSATEALRVWKLLNDEPHRR